MDKKSKFQSARANQFHLFLQPRSKFYSVRLMVDGKRRRFTTGESSWKQARAKAVAIMADIKSRGFEEAVRLHSKHREEVPADPTLEEFISIYRETAKVMDSMPTPASMARYVRCLERVCSLCGVRRILKLDSEAVERFKARYLQENLASGQSAKGGGRRRSKPARDDASVKTTLNAILRNAAAVFSKPLVAAYRLRGLALDNPFAAAKIRKVAIKTYSPLGRKVVDEIWRQSVLLRDGDPKASAPDPHACKRSVGSMDFRVPHPNAYAILLLELGLGLRRNEADKARWDWLISGPQRRFYLEVRAEADFTPKSKQSRIIPVDSQILGALKAIRDKGPFIVPGPRPKRKRAENGPRSFVYRCEEAHRLLVAWLRLRGIDDPKPCHRLRKEFGSYVATTFSLFHAQKLLGHSNPSVTSDYYAGLTDLPHLEPMRMGRSASRTKP